MHSLISSCIDYVKYDHENETLEVTFYSGKVYSYYNLPEDVYMGLLEAYSPGTYYNFVIKGQYNCEKIA